MKYAWMWVAAMLTGVVVSQAKADIDFGFGYSKLELKGVDENLANAGGVGGDLNLSFGILGPVKLNLGAGFKYYDETGDGQSAAHPRESDLLLVTGEIGLSYRHYVLGPVYLEPGFGVVGIVGNYNSSNNTDALLNFDETKTGWGVRPSIRVGATLAILNFGAEFSYMWGDITFDRGVGGDLEEFYAGAFVGLAW